MELAQPDFVAPASHEFPDFSFKVSYRYKIVNVASREVILTGTRIARIDVPPYAIPGRGELEIQLQWRSTLKEFYDTRRAANLDKKFKDFLGEEEYTVQSELLSYTELKTRKETIVAHP